MKCSTCKEPAELKMTWSVHTEGLDKPPTTTGGPFCSFCAARHWEFISSSPFCRDTCNITEV